MHLRCTKSGSILNKAGFTANKQSLTGGQEQFADGQGQSFGGQGLYLGGQGLLCSEITNSANFALSKILRSRSSDRPLDLHNLL